jgi:hypothetical protein
MHMEKEFDPSRPYNPADYLGPGFTPQRYAPVEFEEDGGVVMMPLDEVPESNAERERFVAEAWNAYVRFMYAREVADPDLIRDLATDYSRKIPLCNLVSKLVVPYLYEFYIRQLEQTLREKGPDAIEPGCAHIRVERNGEDVTMTVELPESFVADALGSFEAFLKQIWGPERESKEGGVWYQFAEWTWVNLVGAAIGRVEQEYGETAVELMPQESFEAEVWRRFRQDDISAQYAELLLTYTQELASIVVEALNVPKLSPSEFEVLLGLRKIATPAHFRTRVVDDLGRLMREIALQPQQLLVLTPRKFEEFVASLWAQMGYEVELTPPTRDGGWDVTAVRRAEAEVKYLIECKRYTPPRNVGAPVVRALLGVVEGERATKGILATTASFTPDAMRVFRENWWRLEPADRASILDWIRRAMQSVGEDTSPGLDT